MYPYSFYFYRHTGSALYYLKKVTLPETKQQLKNRLIDGLALYLQQGYIDPYYFNPCCEDEGAEEADDYLRKLESLDIDTAAFFKKRIVTSSVITNGLFKSSCLNELLLSDTYRTHAINYLVKNHHALLSEPLKAAMFYFICAKNDPCDHESVPAALITGIKSRYKKIIEENFSPRYQGLSPYEILTDYELSALTAEYDALCKAYT